MGGYAARPVSARTFLSPVRAREASPPVEGGGEASLRGGLTLKDEVEGVPAPLYKEKRLSFVA